MDPRHPSEEELLAPTSGSGVGSQASSVHPPGMASAVDSCLTRGHTPLQSDLHLMSDEHKGEKARPPQPKPDGPSRPQQLPNYTHHALHGWPGCGTHTKPCFPLLPLLLPCTHMHPRVIPGEHAEHCTLQRVPPDTPSL